MKSEIYMGDDCPRRADLSRMYLGKADGQKEATMITEDLFPKMTEDILALLTLLAGERPDLLPTVIEVMSESPARHAIMTLCHIASGSRESVQPADLAEIWAILPGQIQRLDRAAHRWRHPDEVLYEGSRVEALAAFARHRLGRWRETQSKKPPRRWLRTGRRLQAAVELARTRAQVEAFLNEPASPDAAAGALALIRSPRRNRRR